VSCEGSLQSVPEEGFLEVLAKEEEEKEEKIRKPETAITQLRQKQLGRGRKSLRSGGGSGPAAEGSSSSKFSALMRKVGHLVIRNPLQQQQQPPTSITVISPFSSSDSTDMAAKRLKDRNQHQEPYRAQLLCLSTVDERDDEDVTATSRGNERRMTVVENEERDGVPPPDTATREDQPESDAREHEPTAVGDIMENTPPSKMTEADRHKAASSTLNKDEKEAVKTKSSEDSDNIAKYQSCVTFALWAIGWPLSSDNKPSNTQSYPGSTTKTTATTMTMPSAEAESAKQRNDVIIWSVSKGCDLPEVKSKPDCASTPQHELRDGDGKRPSYYSFQGGKEPDEKILMEKHSGKSGCLPTHSNEKYQVVQRYASSSSSVELPDAGANGPAAETKKSTENGVFRSSSKSACSSGTPGQSNLAGQGCFGSGSSIMSTPGSCANASSIYPTLRQSTSSSKPVNPAEEQNAVFVGSTKSKEKSAHAVDDGADSKKEGLEPLEGINLPHDRRKNIIPSSASTDSVLDKPTQDKSRRQDSFQTTRIEVLATSSFSSVIKSLSKSTDQVSASSSIKKEPVPSVANNIKEDCISSESVDSIYSRSHQGSIRMKDESMHNKPLHESPTFSSNDSGKLQTIRASNPLRTASGSSKCTEQDSTLDDESPNFQSSLSQHHKALAPSASVMKGMSSWSQQIVRIYSDISERLENAAKLAKNESIDNQAGKLFENNSATAMPPEVQRTVSESSKCFITDDDSPPVAESLQTWVQSVLLGKNSHDGYEIIAVEQKKHPDGGVSFIIEAKPKAQSKSAENGREQLESAVEEGDGILINVSDSEHIEKGKEEHCLGELVASEEEMAKGM